MASHNELGKKGELIAQNYLQQQQYTVLHVNWKWGRKEIDVIALKNEQLVFVEVKTRINSVFGWPEEKVDHKKRQYLQGAAEVFMEKSGLTPVAIRFDVIAITFGEGDGMEVVHFEDAF
jgi:putative endonuclease